MNKLEELKARLGSIVAELEGFDGKDDFTTEEMESLNALSTEFEEIKAKIETLEKIEAMKGAANASTRTAPKAAASNNVSVGVDRATLDPKAGFKTAGEFFMTVRKSVTSGQIDKRLMNAGHFERQGEDGGFLIPSDFRTELQKKVMGDESLLSRCRTFQTSSNNIVLPTNEVAPWDGTGLKAYWEAEGASHTESKMKYGQSTLKLHKISVLARCTEELLEDAPALESYLRAEAPEAMVQKINSAIIAGDGAGKPLGFLNSGFKFKQPKVVAQTADTVWFENVNGMYGRLLPMSKSRAVWLVNPAVLPQLPLMKFDQAAASPVPVYMPANGVSGAPYGTLYGLPILPMMGGVKALGDEGDISLVDLNYYYAAVKTAGIKSDISTHVYFLSSETAFKFSMRVGGECIFKSPVTTENGSFSMSGIVTLEDR